MSIDVTRLDCIRGGSIGEATEAVAEVLAAHGLSRVAAAVGSDAEREIYLHRQDGWLVLVDSDPFSEEPWAEHLSGALGGSAVTMRAFPDFGSLEIARFDDGKEVGRVEIDEGTERSRDGWLRVEAPFLAELAPAKSRPALRKGLDVGVLTDEMAVEIARKAGLPAPRDKYQAPPPDATRLAFAKTAFAKKAFAHERAPARFLRDDEGPSAEELADIEAFADEVAAEAPSAVGNVELTFGESMRAEQERTTAMLDAAPPLPGSLADPGALINYLGRAFAVVRAQWNGKLADFEDDLFSIVIELADGLLSIGALGDERDDIQVDMRPIDDEVPIRVGGPLAPSKTARGRALWNNVRAHFAKGADLRLGWSLVHVRYAPYTKGSRAAQARQAVGYEPCPLLLECDVRRPTDPAKTRALAACLDTAVRRCASTKHVVEALVLAQEHPGEIAYPRMAGLWSAIRKRAWHTDHVATPAWRLFVPKAAARKIAAKPPAAVRAEKTRSGVVLACDAPDPFATSIAAMNQLAAHLLPAVGQKAELEALERDDFSGP
jgi:hypothetical protein